MQQSMFRPSGRPASGTFTRLQYGLASGSGSTSASGFGEVTHVILTKSDPQSDPRKGDPRAAPQTFAKVTHDRGSLWVHQSAPAFSAW